MQSTQTIASEPRAGGQLHRIAAFTASPDGGNRAGVWVGASLPDVQAMQAIAAEVGYSETAFVAPAHGPQRVVRYYSPVAEISFCGHATIATGVVLAAASEEQAFSLDTRVGIVPVEVRIREGQREAALTSVAPKHRAASPALIDEFLDILGWDRDELDAAIPPALAYAGAWHLVLAASSRERLARLDYDFDRALAVMTREGVTTLQLVWCESPTLFHARNPFPVGGVVEDAATGASAAALGGYLRDSGLLSAPTTLTVLQGVDMGRPSELRLRIPREGGIEVAGYAVAVEQHGN